MDILPGIWCAIRPACGPDLALSIDENRPGGTPILRAFDRDYKSEAQLWCPVAVFERGAYRGSMLLNRLSGSVLTAMEKNGPLWQTSATDTSAALLWHYVPYRGDYGVIRLVNDSTQAVSVDPAGCGAGSRVFSSVFTNGQESEIWQFDWVGIGPRGNRA
jgi:hypothetical protein